VLQSAHRPLVLRILLVLAALALTVVALAIGLAGAAVVPRPSSGCGRPSLETGDPLKGRIEVNGAERTYVLDAPAGLQAGEPVPLLLDFHGLGHSGAGVWRVSGFRDLARREPFVTVYPDGLPVRLETPTRIFEGDGWELRRTPGNRELDFVRRLLERIEGEYCIDRARVYATGFSNGAYLSQLLACAMADRIAAIAPVSGGLLPGSCEPSRPVPVLIHHGRQDDVIPVEQARRASVAWTRVNGCDGSRSSDVPGDGLACTVSSCRDGAFVEYCEGDFAHRWPAAATSRIWEFLLAHPLGAPR
jgi:polyhydroxybutyrate depolymerase